MDVCLICDNKSVCKSKKLPADKMVSGIESSFGSSNIWDSASDLTFFDPGQYVMWKENLLKNSGHRAWRGLKRLADRKYSEFLWFVYISMGCAAPSSRYLHSSNAALMANNSQSPTSSFSQLERAGGRKKVALSLLVPGVVTPLLLLLSLMHLLQEYMVGQD